MLFSEKEVFDRLRSAVPFRILSTIFIKLPILQHEDRVIFFGELLEIVTDIKPKDSLEWFWARDIFLLNWEIRRLRHLKYALVELERACAINVVKKEAGRVLRDEEIEEMCNSMTGLVVQLFGEEIKNFKNNRFLHYEALERMTASCEVRRDKIVRELESRRERKRRQQDKNALTQIFGAHFNRKLLRTIGLRIPPTRASKGELLI